MSGSSSTTRMVSVPGCSVAIPLLSGGPAQRLGLHVERLRQPLENDGRRGTLQFPALQDADEAVRHQGTPCQLVLGQSLRLPQLLNDLPDLSQCQGSTPIGRNDENHRAILGGRPPRAIDERLESRLRWPITAEWARRPEALGA